MDGEEASVSFAAPGYAADAFIDMNTGRYPLAVDAQGLVAVLNDFHRGRDAGPLWSWLIDLSGVFLTVVSLTGLALLVFLKKIRAGALITLVAGGVIMVGLMRFTV